MITERTLRLWRAQAMITKNHLQGWDGEAEFTKERRETAERILRLTMDLMDIQLLEKMKVRKS